MKLKFEIEMDMQTENLAEVMPRIVQNFSQLLNEMQEDSEIVISEDYYGGTSTDISKVIVRPWKIKFVSVEKE